MLRSTDDDLLLQSEQDKKMAELFEAHVNNVTVNHFATAELLCHFRTKQRPPHVQVATHSSADS